MAIARVNYRARSHVIDATMAKSSFLNTVSPEDRCGLGVRTISSSGADRVNEDWRRTANRCDGNSFRHRTRAASRPVQGGATGGDEAWHEGFSIFRDARRGESDESPHCLEPPTTLLQTMHGNLRAVVQRLAISQIRCQVRRSASHAGRSQSRAMRGILNAGNSTMPSMGERKAKNQKAH